MNCEHQTCGNISCQQDTVYVDIWYPKRKPDDEGLEPIRFVDLGLMDARASDGIRISYDFDRDGWKIEQASTFQWESGDSVCDPDWQEVSFVQSWARERKGDSDINRTEED